MAVAAKVRRRARRRGAARPPARETGPVREMVGRHAPYGRRVQPASRSLHNSMDATRPDYAFYDRLRRGQAGGYSLGGLFAARIERIVADWVLGGGVEVTLREDEDAPIAEDRLAYTNGALAEFVAGLLDAGQDDDEGDPDRDAPSGALLLNVLRDALGLGDQWIVVNADGSLSIPPPDTVEPEPDPLDYRRVLRLTITTRLDQHTIVDEYRADGRTLMVKRGMEIVEQTEFANPIGRIQAVHVAHGRGANELYGHSIHETPLRLYDLYDDVLHKQIDGAKLFGSPIPAFVGLKDLRQAINVNEPVGTETYIDADGNEVARQQLTLDENAVLLVGEGGDVKFLAPPVGFTGDTKETLKLLFLLLLDHTGIPEFIWGNEVSSGRSSSETQMDWFVRSIEGMQRDNGGWIVRLCKIWLQMRALVDPRIVVGPLRIQWPAILPEDMAMKLKRLELAVARDLLTDETLLSLLELVENATAEVEDAAAEAAQRREAEFPDGDTAAFRSRLAALPLDEDAQEDEG